MANIKSAKKRYRQAQVRRNRNKHYMSLLRTQLKIARQAIEEAPQTAQEKVRQAAAIIDRVASKGIIKRERAARTIGRLQKALHGAMNS